jgi:Ran GTPase-activating protein (RanGAP) involved in mRNA processing and transport
VVWSLQANKIGDCGAKLLAELIPTSRLKLLDLAANQIKQDGALALAQCVDATPTLAKLHVFGNGCGHKGIKAITDAYAKRKAALGVFVHR